MPCYGIVRVQSFRILNLCNNLWQGQIPTWLTSLTKLTSVKVSLAQCGVSPSLCVAGYYCDGNSTSLVANPCPTGQYSLSGASSCTLCAAGRFGVSTTMTSPNCSGLCPAGRYGSMAGLSVSSCEASCGDASVYCPDGSVLPVPVSQGNVLMRRIS